MIDSDLWIGVRVTIWGNYHKIGKGTVMGCSVVTRDVKESVIIA